MCGSSMTNANVGNDINLIYELSQQTSKTNKKEQTQQREQTRDKKTNSLAALAGRSAESLGTTTSCDGYFRNVWLTFTHVTSPLNLTPAYPDREKQEQKDSTNKRKEKTNDTKLVPRTTGLVLHAI